MDNQEKLTELLQSIISQNEQEEFETSEDVINQLIHQLQTT
ncbi:hypothetical protein [Thalassobacillus sp. CUG 92003]|nr:hypothetical protein [Thalassobacillus sp. CUG 92003]